MEKITRLATQLCRPFSILEDGYIIFSQSVPDAETKVTIFVNPNHNQKYKIIVYNDRTDAKFNSTPITEVFAERLPNLRGEVEVSLPELVKIVVLLLTIEKRYFGVWVYIKDQKRTFRANLETLLKFIFEESNCDTWFDVFNHII